MSEFSLCAIYKNEEKNLDKFITAHRDLVDEIVLVDTGSTDRSNDIVQQHRLKRHFFQWTHNFSQARNYSLTLSTRPWVIVLDIDEQVLPEDFVRLKTIMAEQQKDAYSLKQINFTYSFDDMLWKSIMTLPPQFHTYAPGYIESPLIRVFRNFKGVCFHGAIHELVGESIHQLHLTSCITDVPIYHMGWTTASRTDEEKQLKQKTYRELIRSEWEKDPSAKMAFYYLSTLENAEEKLRIGFHLTRQYPEVKQFWEVVAGAAVSLQQWSRALGYVEKGLSFHPAHTPLLAIKARCLNETANPLKALEITTQLLNQDVNHPIYWFEKLRALILLKRTTEAETLLRQLPPQFSPKLLEELKKILP